MTQENEPTATPTTLPETKDIKDINKLNAEDKFRYGVIIRGKFIGVEDVKEDHGDEICKTSMIKLKALVEARRSEQKHKQRICVKVTLDGVEILDERTNTPMFNHGVTKISYIARDINDSRAIGYIYKNGPNSYQYFAIKTLGQAQELFNTLKELFEVVLEMRKRNKQQAQSEQSTESSPAKKEEDVATKTEAEATTPTEAKEDILKLEDNIKQMEEHEAQQPSLLDINSSDPNNLVSSFENSMNLAAESVAQTGNSSGDSAITKSNSASDELFSLMDPATNAPSPQENALNMLKAQISNIQSYSVPAPRMAPPAPVPAMPVANPFGVAPAMMTPVGVIVNSPFGGGVGASVPLTQFPPPSGFNNPTPGVFSSQIPNPQAVVNPNPNTSQLPW